jgi:hypothetical protein
MKNKYLVGAMVIGADDVTTAVVAHQMQQPVRPATKSSGGMSWQTILGLVIAVPVTVWALPKLIKYVG